MLVIDEEGAQLGQFLTPDAVDLARERGLDLILVAGDASPPVARIADYGRLKYTKSKRDAASRKNQRKTELKEIKVRPKTDEHDMQVKIRNAQLFLSQGNKVKVTVRFRGREHAHHDIGGAKCRVIADACSELGTVELAPPHGG